MESGGRVSHEEDEVANVGGPVATPSNNLEVDALGRTKLRFSGKTFDDDPDGITKVINKIIHSYYDGPWKTFGEVPDVVQNQWWNEFQSKYFWEDFEGPQIKANWRAKCSKHISNTFSDHRSNKTKPKWVSSKHWATMLTYWENDPKFLLKSEISKKNRASTSLDGGSNYAGGSRSTAGYAIKFKKEKGRDINIEELMKETYTNKKTGEFYTERAKICLDRYNIMANEWLETHESLSKEKQDELWFIASGGDKKGYVYGFGSMYCKNRLVLNPRDINPNPSAPLPPPCHVLAASSSSLSSCPCPVLAAMSSSTAPPALQPSPRIHDVQFVPPMSAPLVLARAPPPPPPPPMPPVNGPSITSSSLDAELAMWEDKARRIRAFQDEVRIGLQMSQSSLPQQNQVSFEAFMNSSIPPLMRSPPPPTQQQFYPNGPFSRSLFENDSP